MPRIAGREIQQFEKKSRIGANMERKYYNKLKRIAKKQNKSISKLVADSLIIMYRLDLNEPGVVYCDEISKTVICEEVK